MGEGQQETHAVAGHSTERPPTWDTCYIGGCCVEAVWVGQGADGSGTAVVPAYGSLRSTTQPNKVSNVASPSSDTTHPTCCSAQPPTGLPTLPTSLGEAMMAVGQLFSLQPRPVWL